MECAQEGRGPLVGGERLHSGACVEHLLIAFRHYAVLVLRVFETKEQAKAVIGARLQRRSTGAQQNLDRLEDARIGGAIARRVVARLQHRRHLPREAGLEADADVSREAHARLGLVGVEVRVVAVRGEPLPDVDARVAFEVQLVSGGVERQPLQHANLAPRRVELNVEAPHDAQETMHPR